MRQERLMALTWGGASLSRTEIYFGFHFCWEWDGLAVGPCSEEWGDGMSCRCGHTLPISRREQRRARKAAKNLVMFKTAGRRPWVDGYMSDQLGDGCEWYSTRYTETRLAHLREPSGFVAMSRVADGLQK